MDLDKLKEEKEGKVEYKMCKAFQEITKEARDEGYKDGRDAGYKDGVDAGYKNGVDAGYKNGVDASMTANITALMETMNLSLEQALDALKITGEYRNKFYS